MAFPERNIFLKNTEQSQSFKAKSSHISSNLPDIKDKKKHADFLKNQLKKSYELSDSQKQAVAIKYKEGTYLEFSGAVGYDLSSQKLENQKNGIRLLKVDTDKSTKVSKALVYIPKGKESVFLDEVEKYATQTTKKGKPCYDDLFRSVNEIRLAIARSFWNGNLSDFPSNTKAWCEIWLRYNDDSDYNVVHTTFENCCNTLNIKFKKEKIKFPERSVRLILANSQDLTNLICANDNIAELRKAIEPTSFFTELPATDQKDITDNILSRVVFNNSDTTICLFDTGINKNHPLLKDAIANDNSVQSAEPSWGIDDRDGHGTEMAGIALYNNLSDLFQSSGNIEINHKLESVKILPPDGQNKQELYGAITEQCVYLAEISNPNAKRIVCMAVTADDTSYGDGRPSSWSGAIDNITSGSADTKAAKRLFLISAGNVDFVEIKREGYPNANKMCSIGDPGQSWNAITVGGYTNSITITDERLKGFSPLADAGELSPYSSTSVMWDKKWPIKPEILFDGGNVATNGSDFFEASDTGLLTTGNDFLNHPLSTIWATSAATAQAALFSARIYSEYPDLWPETVRALMIHSARWTDKMIKQFDVDKTKGSRRNLLRTCGYGIPDLDRALYCLNNQVNLIIESELQPYKDGHMNEMNLHKIPWPNQVLLDLGEINATLHITLSYFIEPSPGEIGWKDKYRYASSALRFDAIGPNETVDDFCKRINAEMRNDDNDEGTGKGPSRNWYLGPRNRDVGSIHSDYWKTTAADLANANYIAVYPVGGWWKDRRQYKKSNKKIRYSLIVSIETPATDTDIYTPIVNQIAYGSDIST